MTVARFTPKCVGALMTPSGCRRHSPGREPFNTAFGEALVGPWEEGEGPSRTGTYYVTWRRTGRFGPRAFPCDTGGPHRP